MNRHANWIFEVKDKIHPINPKAFIVEHFYPEVHNLQDASKFDGQKNRDTVVHLKSGLACVAIFGESPDFLEKSFLGKRKSPDFLEKACFSKIQKSWFFGEILEKDKIRNGKNDWEKHLIRLLTLKSAVKMFKTNFIND